MSSRLWAVGLLAFAGLAATLVACPSLDGLVLEGDAAPDAAPDAAAECGASTPHYLSLEAAARFCTKALTCQYVGESTMISLDIPIDSRNYSSCINWLAGPLPPDRVGVAASAPYLSCVADAPNCPQAGACMAWETIGPGDPRCAGLDASSGCGLNGDVLNCDPLSPFIVHCNNGYFYPGSTCVFAPDSGAYFCQVALDCPDGAVASCSNDLLSYCTASNHMAGIDCSLNGMHCGATDDAGSVDCLGAACNTQGVACDGTDVTVCDGEYTTRFDCAALNGTCDIGSGVPRCKLPCETCSPNDPQVNECNGSVISLCVGGQPSSIDCASLGMACVGGDAGVSAHCE